MVLAADISFPFVALVKLAPGTQGPPPTFLAAVALLSVPVVFLLLVIAARTWFAIKRGKSKSSRCCVHCGYDLRLTPDPIGPTASRCPECGQLNKFAIHPIPR